MKKYITYLILIITTLLVYSKCTKTANTNYNDLQKDISKKIIRFHVIGNSNTEYDQSLKLHIKNAIVQELEPILYNVDNIFYFVDLPGYGYSKMSKQEQIKVGEFIESYLKQNINL